MTMMITVRVMIPWAVQCSRWERYQEPCSGLYHQPNYITRYCTRRQKSWFSKDQW